MIGKDENRAIHLFLDIYPSLGGFGSANLSSLSLILGQKIDTNYD